MISLNAIQILWMVLSEVSGYMSENIIEVDNNGEPATDNTKGYSSYRIPIYGNLNSSGYCSDCTYYPVIATEGGSCLAIDNNRVYVPIKVPTACAVKRYGDKYNNYSLYPSHNTVIDAFDLPDIDIRLLCKSDYSNTKLCTEYYCTGTISFTNNNSFSYGNDDKNALVTLSNLNDMLDSLKGYVETRGESGSQAFWTEAVEVTK